MHQTVSNQDINTSPPMMIVYYITDGILLWTVNQGTRGPKVSHCVTENFDEYRTSSSLPCYCCETRKKNTKTRIDRDEVEMEAPLATREILPPEHARSQARQPPCKWRFSVTCVTVGIIWRILRDNTSTTRTGVVTRRERECEKRDSEFYFIQNK